MKTVLNIALILITVVLMSINSIKKSVSKRYLFKDKYEYSSLELFDNGKFYQTKKGCTYAFTCIGKWTRNQDTILLNQEKFKNTRGNYTEYAKRCNQLIMVSDQSATYSWYRQNGFTNAFVMHLVQ